MISRRLALTLPLALGGQLALAAGVARVPSPSLEDSAAAAAALQVAEAGPERVAGTYNHEGVAVRFETLKTAILQRVVLQSLDGKELVRLEQTDRGLTMSVLGGRAVQTVSAELIAEAQRQKALPPEQRTPLSPAGIRSSGDLKAFETFTFTPEAAAIAWLSRELGTHGYNGRAYPSTYALHVLAMRIATEAGLKLPEWSDDERRRAGGRYPGCLDLRSDPFGDDALGMCGPGTSCWESTCGDCCCHDGCKAHDRTCRNCHWYSPWNCLLCWSFAAFAVGACEDSCQTPDFGPRCPAGGVQPYARCGIHSQECDCNGQYDGSTEDYSAPEQWRCVETFNNCSYCDHACDWMWVPQLQRWVQVCKQMLCLPQ